MNFPYKLMTSWICMIKPITKEKDNSKEMLKSRSENTVVRMLE